MLGGIEVQLNLIDVMLKQQRIRPIAVGNHAMQRRMVRALEELKLKPVIDRTFPLSELSDAFAYQLSGQHMGKIAIDLRC
jgi:NADPH:quinone reductase-like Zn-dependent oxidoreductase